MNLHSQQPIFVLSEATKDPGSISQHDTLIKTLQECGAAVLQVPLAPGLDDSVFIKDSGILRDHGNRKTALLACPHHPQRQAEQKYRHRHFESLGFEVLGQTQNFFEGGDLAVHPQEPMAFLGYGFRTDKKAAAEIENYLGKEIILLELADPELFHLDLALSILGDGTIFACREAFTTKAWEMLTGLDLAKSLIPVSYRDARKFCLNWLEVNDAVVVPDVSENIREHLFELGKEITVVSLHEFQARRGSAACLAIRVFNS